MGCHHVAYDAPRDQQVGMIKDKGKEMSLAPVHNPETDMLLPLPKTGERWDEHTVHTHYFGFEVAEAGIGAFLYIRHMPAFPLCQGGVVIFQGNDNASTYDCAYVDYELAMPWVFVDGNTIRTENGYQIEFLELGKKARLTYESHDRKCKFDVTQTAISPLLSRGHIIPGEDLNADATLAPGGTEQLMHCTGFLELHGERFEVDCYPARDRSLNQIRTEARSKAQIGPPVGWTPMAFGEDLIFCQVGCEDAAKEPIWKDLYKLPASAPMHYFSYCFDAGKQIAVERVSRKVHEYHPQLHAGMKQSVTAYLSDGRELNFEGEALAMSDILSWPNAALRVGVYRWTDETGRIATNSYQEMWFDQGFQHFMNKLRRE